MDSSRALPTGVVTFLLTDIEGSTRLWEADHAAMAEALARHDRIVNTCVRRLNGHVVKSKGEGDSVFAVFRLARDAVTAALVLQCALNAEQWPTAQPIRVRMAIHTGQVDLRDGDYYGPTVNRCARLRALAKGGQVLISGASARLTEGQLPPGASLQDLGSHMLKDLSAPERVWQLMHPRLAAHSGVAPTAAAATPTPGTAAGARAYLLTDHLNHDASGREWGERVSHTAYVAADGSDTRFRCYATPLLAALMNGVERGYRIPRLWDASVDSDSPTGSAILLCSQVTTRQQATLPNLTGLHYARFAVLCARSACEGTRYEDDFGGWAAGWLAGDDSSGTVARQLAEVLEREARPGSDPDLVTLPLPLMLANAARAAMHASKLSWLVGRARDEENARAVACASEAVHIAFRVTQLDLGALAEQCMPKAIAVAPLSRTSSPVSADRILRALPT
ncbi:MAG: adenylate/guanylate cyclase domain-containing protein [Chloroflexi bacterium]|nr:adenylate/guanylate cyclase domain-containing protein [Chloroflexota bacterium]